MHHKTHNTAHRIGDAVLAFQKQTTGVEPEAVTVVLSDQTLVVTLHGTLSRAEQALAKTPDGAAQVRRFHRELFTNASESLRREIEGITGAGVREAASAVQTALEAGPESREGDAVVRVFLMAKKMPVETWSGDRREHPP